MQIRKIGPQPSAQFTIVPNAIVRDTRLSRRARGTMVEIISHADGYHLNAQTLSDSGPEGRDAMRHALDELIACDYMRRVRHQDEQGKWRTDINVYIYGNAPAFVGVKADEVVADEDFDQPTPENPSSVNQSSVAQASTEDQEEDSLTSPSLVVEAPQENSTTSPEYAEPNDSPPVPSSGQPGPLPLVRRRQLMNAGVSAIQGPAWELAWDTVTSMQWPDWAQTEALNYPDEHLAQHIFQTLERGYPLSPSRWVQFYISDRQLQLVHLRGRLDQEARMAEDPAEREARQNRHLPPDRTDLDPTPESGVQQ